MSQHMSMGVGIDRREKDGTVSITVEDEGNELSLNLPWRQAIGLMVSLHHTIHVAAHRAGVGCEEVNDQVDDVFGQMAAVLELEEQEDLSPPEP